MARSKHGPILDTRGGVYEKDKHTTARHWATFSLPKRLIECVLVHEQAHATRAPARQPCVGAPKE
jgi:hypothetical protein